MSLAGPTREVATEEFNGRRAVTLEARADDQHELVDPASQTQTGRWADRNKVDLIRARAVKQSQSPDKYQINNNLIVHLADPIRKPNELQIKMHQTQYKTGPKATFFPSTTTATTNGSSGQATSDPRRTTDAGSRQLSVSNQSGNNQFELNLPLRFGKN